MLSNTTAIVGNRSDKIIMKWLIMIDVL
jgi:hypothetical protein